MQTPGELRLHAGTDSHIKTNGNLFIDTIGSVDMKSGSDFKVTSGGGWDLNVSNNITETASQIHMNGPQAASASTSKEAFWTNRVPAHEPWGRIMYIDTDEDTGNKQTVELAYTDPNVGITELGETTERGPNWHR